MVEPKKRGRKKMAAPVEASTEAPVKQKYAPGAHPNSLAALTYHEGRPPMYGQKKVGHELLTTDDAWGGVLLLAAELGSLRTKGGETIPNVSDLLQKLGLAIAEPGIKDKLVRLLAPVFKRVEENQRIN